MHRDGICRHIMNDALIQATIAAKNQRQPTDSTPLTAADVRAIVESILRENQTPKIEREIIGFNELVARLPLGARSLREGIKEGWIPTIRFPGGRKLLFDWEIVRAALRRFEKGGIQ